MLLDNPGRGEFCSFPSPPREKHAFRKAIGGALEVTFWESKEGHPLYLIWNLKGEDSFALHQCFLTEHCVSPGVHISRGSSEIKGLCPWLVILALWFLQHGQY